MTKREEIQVALAPTMGSLVFKGETIKFFNKGEAVGEIELPSFTFMSSRHILAELARVTEYDDFHLLRADGNKVIASETKGILNATGVDVDNFGVYEGKMYQQYKTAKVCEHCGNKIVTN